MMQELYENFRKYNEDYHNELDAAHKLLEKRRASVARLEKHIEKLEFEHEGWIQRVLKPLADTISSKLGNLSYEIYGPFGLTCETSVYFFPGEARSIVIDETFSINVTPWFDREEHSIFHLEYWNGENTEEYPRGSIGWMNGMNKVRKELPDDIDEIIPLLHHNNPPKINLYEEDHCIG